MKSIICILAIVLMIPVATAAQGNGFSFQGRLNDGTNSANGAYDLQFKLYDAVTGGNQIGPLAARPNTVLANGVFSVVLDFGATAFNNPASVFIEIAVKPNGSPNAYTILGPRQQLTVVPYAVRAMNATNADNATIAQNAVNATNANHAVSADHSASTDIATFAFDATNAVNATNAAQATTATTANNALAVGGVPVTQLARLNFDNTGDIRTTGTLKLVGNAQQSLNGAGIAKAFLVVGYPNNNAAQIQSCYNAVTNNGIAPCDFTIENPLSGVTRIGLGYPINGRYVSISPLYAGGTLNLNDKNYGANYRFFGTSSLEIFTFAAGNSADTTPSSFQLIIY